MRKEGNAFSKYLYHRYPIVVLLFERNISRYLQKNNNTFFFKVIYFTRNNLRNYSAIMSILTHFSVTWTRKRVAFFMFHESTFFSISSFSYCVYCRWALPSTFKPVSKLCSHVWEGEASGGPRRAAAVSARQAASQTCRARVRGAVCRGERWEWVSSMPTNVVR